MGTLYIVATPIGNLEDVTLRALRVLREARLIAAEDTRTTRKLLAHFDIHTPLTSFHDANAVRKLPGVMEALGQGDVALVSEAGMPLVSDPGYQLVTEALAQGIPMVVLPGASAVTTALAVSGLPAGQFLFLGFLPRKQGGRRDLLEALTREPRTMVAFEAPHRLRRALQDILTVLGDRHIAVCRELTKLHEEVFRGRCGRRWNTSRSRGASLPWSSQVRTRPRPRLTRTRRGRSCCGFEGVERGPRRRWTR